MGRCQGEEKLGCSVGGRGDSRSHCETTKPLFKSYHSSPEPGWGWGNPGHIWVKGLTRKHSVIHSSIHHISEQLCDCKFKYFLSYLNLVQLYTCILAILHTCLSGCRSGWSSPKSGWGLSRVRVRGWVRGKKLPQQLPPLLLGSHLPKLHHRPKDQTKQGSPGSDWVSLGVGLVWIYKRGCSRIYD